MSKIEIEVRAYSLGEEIANAVSHGLGLLVALAATPWLILNAAERGGTAAVVGASVFSATLALMFLTSTLYHAMPHAGAKRVLRLLDHNAIFLLIAGTYTPIAVVALRSAGGWWLLGAVWFMAIFGMVLDAVRRTGPRIGSILLYLAMGWFCVLALDSLQVLLPPLSLWWLIIGGVFYTSGIAFFVLDSWYPWCHGIWHLFVLAGSVSHYFAILLL